MPIIGQVGRRSWKVRFLNIIIHLILLVGGVTMVYPFLVMISGSFKSNSDFKNFNMIPEFLHNDTVLFRKYLITKNNDNTNLIFNNMKNPVGMIERIDPPIQTSEAVVDDFRDLVERRENAENRFFFAAGLISEKGVFPLQLRKFRAWMKQKYGDGEEGLEKINAALNTDFKGWDEIYCPGEVFFMRRMSGHYEGFLEEFLEFKMQTKTWTRNYFDIDGFFMEVLRRDLGSDLSKINRALGTNYRHWQQIVLPKTCPKHEEFAKVWTSFVREELNLVFIRVNDSGLPAYHAYLKKQYDSKIDLLNKAYKSSYKSFDKIKVVDSVPTAGDLRTDWNKYITYHVPADALYIDTLSIRYRDLLKAKYGDIAKLNAAHNRGYKKISDVLLPTKYPEGNLSLRSDWVAFLAETDKREIDFARHALSDYRTYLSEQYTEKEDEREKVEYKQMSLDYEMRINKKDDVPFFQKYPAQSTKIAKEHHFSAMDDARLIKKRVIGNPAKLQAAWTSFLEKRYATVNDLNQAYGMIYSSWDSIPLPIKEWEWGIFKKNHGPILREFLKRNYIMVLDTVLYNGHAAFNTVIYCVLAVLAALIVNPMAAYALSRYKPPSTYKILLILMLTMAFPPMVLGIPRFLLIKNLGLLNTFGALILPTMANGYAIFLLKGFFDSLPQELFECAQIEGASEWQIFWNIAMALSKPILAVIALQTFTMAYGNFMLAFLVCQKQSMWTLMVYLYQLQQSAGPAVGFASLIIAAIPTFLVFLFCQNLIIRGIVVPTEK